MHEKRRERRSSISSINDVNQPMNKTFKGIIEHHLVTSFNHRGGARNRERKTASLGYDSCFHVEKCTTAHISLSIFLEPATSPLFAQQKQTKLFPLLTWFRARISLLTKPFYIPGENKEKRPEKNNSFMLPSDMEQVSEQKNMECFSRLYNVKSGGMTRLGPNVAQNPSTQNVSRILRICAFVRQWKVPLSDNVSTHLIRSCRLSHRLKLRQNITCAITFHSREQRPHEWRDVCLHTEKFSTIARTKLSPALLHNRSRGAQTTQRCEWSGQSVWDIRLIRKVFDSRNIVSD